MQQPDIQSQTCESPSTPGLDTSSCLPPSLAPWLPEFLGREEMTLDDLEDGFFLIQILSITAPQSVDLAWYTTDTALRHPNIAEHNRQRIVEAFEKSVPLDVSAELRDGILAGDVGCFTLFANMLHEWHMKSSNEGSVQTSADINSEQTQNSEGTVFAWDAEYEPSEVSFKSSVRWLLRFTLAGCVDGKCVRVDRNAIEELQVLLDSVMSSDRFLPAGPILSALTYGAIYQVACEILFDKVADASEIHSFTPKGRHESPYPAQFLKIFSDQGYLDFRASLKDTVKDMVVDRTPFYESIHSKIIENLIKADLRDFDMKQLTSHFSHTFPGYNTEFPPYDIEDALMMWANLCANQIKQECRPTLSASDLDTPRSAPATPRSIPRFVEEWVDVDNFCKDFRDGRALNAIALFYGISDGIVIDTHKIHPTRRAESSGASALTKLKPSNLALAHRIANLEVFERACVQCAASGLKAPPWRPEELARSEGNISRGGSASSTKSDFSGAGPNSTTTAFRHCLLVFLRNFFVFCSGLPPRSVKRMLKVSRKVLKERSALTPRTPPSRPLTSAVAVAAENESRIAELEIQEEDVTDTVAILPESPHPVITQTMTTLPDSEVQVSEQIMDPETEAQDSAPLDCDSAMIIMMDERPDENSFKDDLVEPKVSRPDVDCSELDPLAGVKEGCEQQMAAVQNSPTVSNIPAQEEVTHDARCGMEGSPKQIPVCIEADKRSEDGGYTLPALKVSAGSDNFKHRSKKAAFNSAQLHQNKIDAETHFVPVVLDAFSLSAELPYSRKSTPQRSLLPTIAGPSKASKKAVEPAHSEKGSTVKLPSLETKSLKPRKIETHSTKVKGRGPPLKIAQGTESESSTDHSIQKNSKLRQNTSSTPRNEQWDCNDSDEENERKDAEATFEALRVEFLAANANSLDLVSANPLLAASALLCDEEKSLDMDPSHLLCDPNEVRSLKASPPAFDVNAALKEEEEDSAYEREMEKQLMCAKLLGIGSSAHSVSKESDDEDSYKDSSGFEDEDDYAERHSTDWQPQKMKRTKTSRKSVRRQVRIAKKTERVIESSTLNELASDEPEPSLDILNSKDKKKTRPATGLMTFPIPESSDVEKEELQRSLISRENEEAWERSKLNICKLKKVKSKARGISQEDLPATPCAQADATLIKAHDKRATKSVTSTQSAREQSASGSLKEKEAKFAQEQEQRDLRRKREEEQMELLATRSKMRAAQRASEKEMILAAARASSTISHASSSSLQRNHDTPLKSASTTSSLGNLKPGQQQPQKLNSPRKSLPTIKQQSNRKLIKNALLQVCLAGSVNEKVKADVMEDLEASSSSHFIILFRGPKNHAFKGLYSYDAQLQQVLKVYAPAFLSGGPKDDTLFDAAKTPPTPSSAAGGPSSISEEDVMEFYKYDSGSRSFKVVPTKSFGVSVHAVALRSDFGRKAIDAKLSKE
ncbi:Calmodulin-regulated spectrin-associated protein 1 [Chytriomyces hyalinus]|nr:Calmodulin-regulated spectrin-associated protein 1 [Chytriomyces hyalinus]